MKRCIDFCRHFGTDRLPNKDFRKLPLEIKFLYYYRILHELEKNGVSKKNFKYKYYVDKFKKIK